jgi:hypothetical protein
MKPIHYTHAQVALMARFASAEGKPSTPESFGLVEDGCGYVWQPR